MAVAPWWVRRFWRWEHRDIALVLVAMAVEAWMAGCAPRPQAREPISRPTPYCFSALARFNERDQLAVGCFESPALCGASLARAKRWGGMAGLTQIGACMRQGE